MVPDGSCIVVHLVESREAGGKFARTRMAWPLHITLVPWFWSVPEETVGQVLREVAATQPGFSLTVGEEARLRPNNIAANSMTNPGPCIALHQVLVGKLCRHNPVFVSERWIGENYKPHITHHGEHRRHQGDIEQVRHLTFVRLTRHNTCEIVHHFPLHV